MPLSSACNPLRSLASAVSSSFAIFSALAASSLLNSSSLAARSTSSAMFLPGIDDGALYSLLEDGLPLGCVASTFSFAGVLLGFALRFSVWSGAAVGVAFAAVGLLVLLMVLPLLLMVSLGLLMVLMVLMMVLAAYQ